MSNAERWDHSGYRELQNEEKSSIVGTKRPSGSKKGFYKYKEGQNPNEKVMMADFMDQSGHRKNPNKKFSNFSGIKYNNEEWNADRDKNPDNDRDSALSFKNKQKKKKKEDFYPNYDSSENYFRDAKLNEDGTSQAPPMNMGANYASYTPGVGNQQHPQNISNHHPQMNHLANSNLINPNMPFNHRKKPSINPNTPMAGGFNPNFYNNNGSKNMMNNYGNYNTMYNPGFNNMPPMNQNFMSNSNSNSNKNLVNVPYNNLFYSQGSSNSINNNLNVSNSEPNSKLVMTEDNSVQLESDSAIGQQSDLLSNETTKNKKMVRNLVETIKSNKQGKGGNQNSVSETNDTNASQSEEGVPSGLMHTPQRNSVASSGVGANTGNSNFHNSSNNLIHTPGNSVGFSPKNEQIYMCNILKMPNNMNFNSPMRQMNENFMFQNHPGSNRGPPINLNSPYYGMMPGMSPMNINVMDANIQMPVNNIPPNNLNIHPPQMHPNFNSFPYNSNHNMVKAPPINAQGNMSKFNSTSSVPSHEEPNENRNNQNSGQKKFQSNPNVGLINSNNNSNIQFQRNTNSVGSHGPSNNPMGNKNPFEKSPTNNTINPNFYNNKKNINPNINHSMGTNLTPNMNPNINPNINSNLTQNINPNMNPNMNLNMNPNMGMNLGGGNFNNQGMPNNNRPYNNRKFNNNNNINMQGMNNNNPLYKGKFIKSDKYLNNSLKDGRQMNQMNQMGNMMNMMGNMPNQMNNPMMNGPIGDGFSNHRMPNQNKVWRNNTNTSNNFPGNQSKINELTNIINSTIRDPGSATKSNKNLPQAGSFESIKEELRGKEQLIAKKDRVNCYSSENSDYEMAEEEVKLFDKARNNESFALFVSVKLNGRDETITVIKGEDVFQIAKAFVFKHQLNQNLVKPIGDRIRQALSSIDEVLYSTLNEEEHKSLSAIQTYYAENKFEDESDFVNMLDLSCMTDIGSPGTFLSDTEDFKKPERLNISR